MDEDLIEKKISSEDVFDGNLLHVKRDKVLLPNGNISYREWIKHPGAAAVLPVTNDGKLIFVRQYRYPIQQVTLEIPAGKYDRPGEDPLECAQRELSEETGYDADEFVQLGRIATTVGFSDEFITIFLAKGLHAGEKHPDDDEFINVQVLSLEDVKAKIHSGEICDAKSIAAVMWLQETLNK